MIKFILYLILFSSTYAFSQEKSIHGFCFVESVSFGEVKSFLNPISLPNDQMDMMGRCLEVLVTDSRAQLYETYLQKKFRLGRVYKGTASESGQIVTTIEKKGGVTGNCTINLVQKRNKNKEENEFSLGHKNILKQTDSVSEGDSSSQLVLGKGLPGSLQIDKEEIFVTCFGGNNGNYTLTISLKSPNSGISTTINIMAKQPLNIGSIVKDLSGKSHTASVDSGISYQSSEGQEQTEYFLSVE